MTLRPGEIVLDHATRTFNLNPERSRTLKELFVRGSGTRGLKQVEALHDVTLGIEPGEAVGLVGRNGAGKTSTLRCLAGIVPLDSGRAEGGGRGGSPLQPGARLGPQVSWRENIYPNRAPHRLSPQEIE